MALSTVNTVGSVTNLTIPDGRLIVLRSTN
jgi:hypothetical protein